MKLMQRKLRYSDGRQFNLYHLYYYFSKAGWNDADKNLILGFKKYEETSVRRLLIEAIENSEWLDINDDALIVRALNSHEIHIGDRGSIALDRLGLSLSAVYDCTYLPSVIFKKREITSIKALNIAQRKAALKDAYGFYMDEFEEFPKVLIIDDIVTTGATACAIIQAIFKALPDAEITVFALAWTPTAKQQEYIIEHGRNAKMLNEPEAIYGEGRHLRDVDFEEGETDVSLFL